jgi:hypothetical protein
MRTISRDEAMSGEVPVVAMFKLLGNVPTGRKIAQRYETFPKRGRIRNDGFETIMNK